MRYSRSSGPGRSSGLARGRSGAREPVGSRPARWGWMPARVRSAAMRSPKSRARQRACPVARQVQAEAPVRAGGARRPQRRPGMPRAWSASPAPSPVRGVPGRDGIGRPDSIGRCVADSSVGGSGIKIPDEGLGDGTSPLEGGHRISGDERAARRRHRRDDTPRAGGSRPGQPSTTCSSRGASLRTSGPSSPHTTMSSILAPYSPGR